MSSSLLRHTERWWVEGRHRSTGLRNNANPWICWMEGDDETAAKTAFHQHRDLMPNHEWRFGKTTETVEVFDA